MKNLFYLVLIGMFFCSCSKKANTGPETLPDPYSNQATGKSAGDLLGSARFTSLNVQIQYMPGYPLDTATISYVYGYLNGICNKPGGITISKTEIPATGDTLNVNQIATLEKQYRTAYTSGSTVSVYVLVTNGFDTSVSVLGLSYRNTSICLFGRDIYANSGGPAQVSRVRLETSVLEHELGHLMGLVNLGTPMLAAHQDVAHGNHCTNTSCLMYWETETHASLFGGNSTIPVLDSNCLADLRGNGGK